MAITYKSAGVDIQAGDEAVKRIKNIVRSTFNSGVLSDIGHFGAFYELNFKEYQSPVLVSSTDGVGTKLKVAFLMGVYNTVGEDLVNHCVNDILVCGAKPLYFLDYFATGKLDVNIFEKVIEGLARGCKNSNCALIGGETAEMPGFYSENEFDIAGMIVGIVEKSRIIDGKSIKKGDILIGLPSSGLHTNGYSLARKVLFPKYKINTYIDELGKTIGEALLAVHRCYLKQISSVWDKINVKGLSHVTGGGLVGNTMRIIPDGLSLKINWNSWEISPIFKLIQKIGDVPDEDMKRTMNLGVGIVAIVEPNDVNKLIDEFISLGEKPFVVGEVV
jgi:phosphoribosylformylglycinamidine cyclo-ligase